MIRQVSAIFPAALYVPVFLFFSCSIFRRENPKPVISDSIPDLVYDFSDSQIPAGDIFQALDISFAFHKPARMKSYVDMDLFCPFLNGFKYRPDDFTAV